MNKPNTELDKAIESAEQWTLISCIPTRQVRDVHQLLLAAKLLKEVEKERDEANQRLVNLANKVWDTRWITEEEVYQNLVGIAAEIRSGNLKSVEQQLSQLRTDYKKALEALEKAKQWIEVDSTESCDCATSEHCSYCSKATYTLSAVDKALSTPSAIAARKDETK